MCEACKTGYFGFPECKPCDCPSTAICEKRTGGNDTFIFLGILLKIKSTFLFRMYLSTTCYWRKM